MLTKNDIKNARTLPLESEFKNTFYEDENFKKRRNVLRETVKLIKEQYKNLYANAQRNLNQWSQQSQENQRAGSKVEIGVYEGDWGVVTHKLTKRYGRCFAVLNMANAQVPGGGYLEGSPAQEENIFRRTDCHFSINKNKLNNDGFYKDEWTDLLNGVNGRVYLDKERPRICIRGHEIRNQQNLGYDWLSENDIFPFYELRSAAVDLRIAGKFNKEECKKRIRAQFSTLMDANVKHVVLGAHGCGAFENPTEKVAETYSEVIAEYQNSFHNVSFAIYNAGYGPNNYTPFANQFSKIMEYKTKFDLE